MLKDFKAFILRGNVVDLAVGVIIGAAFGKIVSSLVSDIIMPPIGLLLGGIDFSNKFVTLRAGTAAVNGTYASIAAAKADKGAVILSYGLFVNAVVEFLIIAFCVYLLVQQVNRLFPKQVTTKDCPQCASAIPLAALRCPHCTSQLSLS